MFGCRLEYVQNREIQYYIMVTHKHSTNLTVTDNAINQCRIDNNKYLRASFSQNRQQQQQRQKH